MVGRDGNLIPSLHTRIIDRLDRLVRRGDRFHRGVEIAGMSDHVGRGKVAHDEFVFLRLDRLGDRVGYSLGVHLGLLVVGGHLGGGDHDPLFALELLFDTSVEEERDVGVFLGLWRQARHVEDVISSRVR